MLLRTLLNFLKPEHSRMPVPQGRRRNSRHRPTPCRLAFEALEDRQLLATMFVVGDAQIIEGDAGTQKAAVVVSLTGPHGQSLTVNYRTADGTASAGSDYDAVAGKLTFAKNEMSKTVFVPVRGDTALEADESFSVQLSNAKGAKIADATGVVTIRDDDPRISISEAWASEGNFGTTQFNFTVSLSHAYNEVVTVDFATADGSATADSDYLAASGTLIFGANQTSQIITVDVNGDRTFESTETFVVNLSNSIAQITNSVGYGTIYDDEPRIGIGDAYYYIGYGQTSFTFTVSLSTAYDQEVTVDFATMDGTAIAGVDYVATSAPLTFAIGETTKTITVDVIDAAAYDKYLFVHLSAASPNALIANEWAYGFWYYDYGYYDYGYYDSYDNYYIYG